jgi:hypothetical protein
MKETATFREVWRIRNEIIHGTREPELATPEESALAGNADQLAATCLEAAVARFRAVAVEQGKIIVT